MSVVYFVRVGEEGPVKIGVATNLKQRLSGLQISHPEKLVVIRVIVGNHEVEKWLHDYFSKDKIRGEWFSYNMEMMTIEPPSFGSTQKKKKTKSIHKHRAGRAAYEKKIGIHSYSKETLTNIRRKGNEAFVEKWKSEEFRKLHSERIKAGIRERKLEKEQTQQNIDFFGFQ